MNATAIERAQLAADYEALHCGVGARRMARDAVRVEGPEAAGYLQGQCSQDVLVLDEGAAVYTLLLAPDGKLDLLARVIRVGPDHFIVDTEAGYGDGLAVRLAKFKLRTKVTIEPIEWGCTAVRGPAARDALAGAVAPGALVVPVAWGGWTGCDVLGPDTAEVPEVRWVAEAAWEACLVEAGVPRMGCELDARTIAPEVPGLVEQTVSFTKGCFTGQELVARLDSRGSRVARVLRGLVVRSGVSRPDALVGASLVAAAEPEKASEDQASEHAPAAGARARAVGACTSAAWCPGVGAVAGLGYVHRSVAPGALVRVVTEDGTEPDRQVRAEVRELPLV